MNRMLWKHITLRLPAVTMLVLGSSALSAVQAQDRPADPSPLVR